jgi:PAP_fibrillin
MTTYGYTLPDPEVSNRHSIWITGGRIEPNSDPADQVAWMRYFEQNPPKRSFGDQAKLLAVKLLMGAEIDKTMNAEDGSMTYTFTRPLGGHGLAYLDTLFVDESLRIVRGHRGTVFVFTRLPQE